MARGRLSGTPAQHVSAMRESLDLAKRFLGYAKEAFALRDCRDAFTNLHSATEEIGRARVHWRFTGGDTSMDRELSRLRNEAQKYHDRIKKSCLRAAPPRRR